MKKLLVVAGLLMMTAAAYAAPVTMEFIGFQLSGWQAGYPYYATINNGPVIDVMCDDWAHGGLPGQTWLANYTNLGTGNLSLVRFNPQQHSMQLTALDMYHEVGWLLLQTEVTPPSDWTDINSAVWYIFDQDAQLTQGAPYWLNQAYEEYLDGFTGVNFYDVAIYTPLNQHDTDPNGPQELLTIIPEPGTLTLIGCGLVGLLTRKKRR